MAGAPLDAEDGVRAVYVRLLHAWNRRRAADFADAFL